MGSRPGMPAAVPCQTAGCTIDRQGGTLAYVRHHLLHLSAVAVSPVVCASLYWAVSLPARGLTSAAPSPRNRRAGNLLAPYVTACTSDVLFSFYQRMKARQVRRVWCSRWRWWAVGYAEQLDNWGHLEVVFTCVWPHKHLQHGQFGRVL